MESVKRKKGEKEDNRREKRRGEVRAKKRIKYMSA